MLIGIRVDASLKMGTGHTFRMLTLAKQLDNKGHQVFFICRRLQGDLLDFVRISFDVIELPAPENMSCTNQHCAHAKWLEVDYEVEIAQTFQAVSDYLQQTGQVKLDWLIVDHYAIEKQFQLAMQPLVRRCMQVDDLADREHCVDLLLDQNYYQQGSMRYDGLLPESTQRLCGPEFALLREEFSLARQQLAPYAERLLRREVVLFFGGIDIANETTKALLGLLSVESDDHFQVIIGMNNPHSETIKALCQQHSDRVSLHIQVSNMTDFFASAYLYVGAVGATTWERCVMALPGLVCSVADNQKQVADDLHNIGAHCYLGINTELTSADYQDAYQQLLVDQSLLQAQSELCAQFVDGNGCCRVISFLENTCH